MQPGFKTTDSFRQCVGIDVAKATFMASLTMLDGDVCSTPPIEFANDRKGFNQLVRWTRKEALKGHPVSFVMEPTGVYYEALAVHLTKIGFPVHVIPANRARDYARSEGYKTKTDKVDARILSLLGCEKRRLAVWTAPDEELSSIRSLCRFRSALVKQRTMLKNQLEALSNSVVGAEAAIKLCRKALADVEKNVAGAETEIARLTDNSQSYAETLGYAVSVPGVGPVSAAVILSETGCFANFSSSRQAVSFTGLDVVARQSGPCDPRRRISKQGNPAIRGVLYVCAMSAIRHNEEIRNFYNRVKKSNPAGKVALVAVMRKLLTIVFAVCKNRKMYDPEYNTAK